MQNKMPNPNINLGDLENHPATVGSVMRLVMKLEIELKKRIIELEREVQELKCQKKKK